MKRFDFLRAGLFLALFVGALPTPRLCGQSSTNWFPRPAMLPSAGELYGVAFSQGRFVAVGDGGIATSPDGSLWTQVDIGTNRWLQGVGASVNAWVAVGWNGVLLSSPDGLTWTNRDSGTTNLLYDVAYGAGVFVTVGGVGTVRVSTDGGTNWVGAAGTGGGFYDGVAWGEGRFVAVGFDGAVMTSTNGLLWSANPLRATPEYLDDVAWGAGRFVAVGSGGTILTSTNGLDWTPRTSGTDAWLFGIGYGNGRFIAVGETGTILSSPDGADWTSESYPIQTSLHSAAAAEGGWVLTDGSGGVLVSGSNPTGDGRYVLVNPRIGLNGLFMCDVTGILSGERVEIQATDQPGPAAVWSLVTPLVGTGDLMTFEDPSSGGRPYRFYRVRKESSQGGDGRYVLATPRIGLNRQLTIEVTGVLPGERVDVESSDELGPAAAWSVVAQLVGTGSPLSVEDPSGISRPSRFYRVRKG